MTASINTSSPAAKAPSDLRTEASARATPSTADRQGFEHAIERAQERVKDRAAPARARSDEGKRDENEDNEERDAPPKVDGATAASALAALPAMSRERDTAGAELLAALSPLAAPVFAACEPVPAPAANPTLSLSQFNAALSQLQAPAGAAGTQQWQFSLAERSGPLAGVQLNTTAGGPWQMTLQGSARDRAALHAGLDKLRTRLRTRGANVGDVRVEAERESDE
jgi:hypothetical protein